METNVQTKKVTVHSEPGFKIKHIQGYKGWACQCSSDCYCNEDYVKKNGREEFEFFRIYAPQFTFKKASQCTFKTLEEALIKITNLKDEQL